MDRIRRLLLSRKLAAGLIAGLVVFFAAATFIPRPPSVSLEELEVWRVTHEQAARLLQVLGLDAPFRSVLFLTAAGLLTACTAACAWQRTKAARVFTAGTAHLETLFRLLEHKPSFSLVATRPEPEAVVPIVVDVLRSLGMSVRVNQHAVVAKRRTLFAFGSAVFHWSLVALFVTAGLGQLLRWEGLIGIPVGERIVDNVESYGFFDRGPLASSSPNTGFAIEVPEMDLEYVSGGVQRGYSPRVRLLSGNSVVADSRVFPNHPLRHGTLQIHRNDWGLAAVVSLETTSGAEVSRRHFLFDFSETDKSGRIVLDGALGQQAGSERVTFELQLDPARKGGFRRDVPDGRRIIVSVGESDDATITSLGAGDSLTLSGGQVVVRLKAMSRYARLMVVNDPMIPFVYFSFVSGSLAALAALFVHPRLVVLEARRDSSGVLRVSVLTLSKKLDPLFRTQLEDRLSAQLTNRGPE